MRKEEKKTLPIRYCYPALFSTNEGVIQVTFPDLDCCVSARDEKSAVRAAEMKLGRYLFQLEQTGEEIPKPSSLFELSALEGEKAGLIDVYMPSIRLAETSRSVNRMVSLPAWMNAAAMERRINFSHTLQEALRKEIFNDIKE